MKSILKSTIITRYFFILLMSVGTLACSSEEGDGDDFIGTTVDKQFSIQKTGELKYYLGEFGESGTATIILQAKHFKTSKLVGSDYIYEPENGYIGMDYVEVTSSVSNIDTGGNNTSKNTKTRITITITD